MKKTTIHVDRLSLEGDGVGRISSSESDSGKVAFVPYTLPEEDCEATLLLDKKNHSRWLPTHIVKSSASRIEPACPYHFKPGKNSSWCGGCDWQQQTPLFQQKAKRQLVVESLERLGGLVNPPVHETLSTSHFWRYRNKVQVPFAGVTKKIKAGFYSPGTHDIVEFDDCLVQPELSVRIVRMVKKCAEALRWVPYNEDAHRGWLRHVLVRTNEKGQAMVVIVTADSTLHTKNEFLKGLRQECPEVIGVFQNVQSARTHVILGRHWTKLWGAERLEENILGLKMAYSPASFFQVNTKAAELLYEKAIEELAPEPDDGVLDLFCGVGALTLLAAQKTRFAVGIEWAASSIRDAQFNADMNRIRNAKFVESDAARYLNSLEGRQLREVPNTKLLVMVDPPRSGCAPELIQNLLNLKAKRIVYVSCNPATLARDVKLLSSLYRVSSVTPVDLFPQTSHIESVTRLDLVDR